MKTLSQILDKLQGTDNESLISEINASVDALKAKAVSIKEKEITSLKEQINDFEKEITTNTINGAIKELVGDDEKQVKLLKALTKLNGLTKKDDITKEIEKTMEEYKEHFVKPETQPKQQENQQEKQTLRESLADVEYKPLKEPFNQKEPGENIQIPDPIF